MSLARIHNFSISLDGFGTGEGQSLEAPFGHAGERLHEWMFMTQWWNREMIGHPGGTGGIDDAFARLFAPGIGAEIMGADYLANRRMVSDDGVVTTTGISASIPTMLTLIEAIAGRTKAEMIARDLGVEQWSAQHASGAFKLTRPFATTVLLNIMAFWNREELGIRIEPGMDEVSLALVADAWSRTYRSSVTTFANTAEAIESRSGVRVIPNQTATNWAADPHVSTFPNLPPAEALDQTLEAITDRYGERTTHVVAMQLEYPR